MNRRSLFRSALAAFAITTGMARAKLHIPEPAAPDHLLRIEFTDGQVIYLHEGENIFSCSAAHGSAILVRDGEDAVGGYVEINKLSDAGAQINSDVAERFTGKVDDDSYR